MNEDCRSSQLSKKKKTDEDLFFDAVKQSRPRDLIPSPKIFRDRTKFNRNQANQETRREILKEEE